jgi:hypothetical protein
MPRVVPSQVVDFINTLWPSSNQHDNLAGNDAGQLAALIDIVDQIPDELLTMDSPAYARFICGKGQIKQKLVTWAFESNPSRWPSLGLLPGNPPRSPVTEIRDTLAMCPDESPAPGTSELNFIPDADFRANLRNDIGAVYRALASGEWKGATILAGSAAEALLLWALQRCTPAEITTAIATLRASNDLSTNPDPNALESREWNLYGYIQVAENLDIIEENTATAARLAKNFRDLIHPGRAQRLALKCDRGTAHLAVAAMALIIRDLTP